MNDPRVAPVSRRQVLKVSGAGLAVAALPACSVSEFHYVPVGGDASGFVPEGDSGAPAPDSGAKSVADSSAPPPPNDSSVAGQDVASPPPNDASPIVDSTAPPPEDTAVPPPTCAQDSNTLVVPISQYPQLGSTGGSVTLSDSRYSDPNCQQDGFYIVATGPGEFAAFSTSCTHRCCTIQISGSSASCPCHGARFDVATGAVTQGPANTGLPALPGVCTDGKNIYLKLA